VIAVALCESAQIAMMMVWIGICFCSANGGYSTAGRKSSIHKPAYPPTVAGNTICFYTGRIELARGCPLFTDFMCPDKLDNSPEAWLDAAFHAYRVHV
jgi:hypothetical protein